ncbi:MAG: mannose-1-phosphate guanylyltransferase [Isosphaeraceae bacterium]|jgi:mannose-1-phosphate guanylyltransferase|nr:MAG: mannose-1-phosphate guanylyltransferase [Isosphaeraceae bacterium]
MLHAVIMAGGSGTRFWPKSRRDRPKQLLRLVGEATMLRQTVDRVAGLAAADQTWVVTGADQAAATRRELPELPEDHIVAEPCPRDTAACVGLAAALVAAREPDATLLMLPADHVVRPSDTFRQTIRAATQLVAEDPTTFVTLGVRPTRPETGYGYIEQGESLGERLGFRVYQVRQFCEKPDRGTAEQFLAHGRFVWNSGVFVWNAQAILDAIGRFRPRLAEGLDRIRAELGTPSQADALARVYPTLERVPIDKAVMEHYPNVKVIDVTYEWSDVGDWRTLAEYLGHDAAGNAAEGPTRIVDSRGCVVIADEGRLIATLGVDDLVVVQSGGATLVARKDRLDQLKSLVEGLREAGYEGYL